MPFIAPIVLWPTRSKSQRNAFGCKVGIPPLCRGRGRYRSLPPRVRSRQGLGQVLGLVLRSLSVLLQDSAVLLQVVETVVDLRNVSALIRIERLQRPRREGHLPRTQTHA